MGTGSWIWEVDRVVVGQEIRHDEEKLARLLDEGWEPFAVTPSQTGAYVYHFRRHQRGGDR